MYIVKRSVIVGKYIAWFSVVKVGSHIEFAQERSQRPRGEVEA